jgi:glycosyltransferase involved in cell wall biosynthesis
MSSTLEDDLAWLRVYITQRGHPLRVLHVGNIANNAYLNAKFLRSVGIDAHVLSNDYYHVMAMPEWEDVELRHSHGDDYQPRFSERDLGSYRRPAWFMNAPLFSSPSLVRDLFGEHLPWRRRAVSFALQKFVQLSSKLKYGGLAKPLLTMNPPVFFFRLSLLFEERFGPTGWISNIVYNLIGRRAMAHLRRWIAAYDEAFPVRPDRLAVEDVAFFDTGTHYFREIFRNYDIVQCYGTDPINALLADKHPFVAFEHGTLRDFTMGNLPLHRLTALAYRKADHTFITNGDCRAYAEQLGIDNYSPMVHPIDVDQHRRDYGDDIASLRKEIGADVVLFCPIRHDWKAKGTDVHLRALPLIKARISGRVKLVLICWGQQILESEALLEHLDCVPDVVWRSSMCRISMIKHIRAADVVLDQMAFPHFGAIAPQSMAAGTPVVSSYDPESTRWIIPEPAPILSAFSPADVATAVVQALDPMWLLSYRRRAQGWVDKYHHPKNVIHGHLRIYRRILDQ